MVRKWAARRRPDTPGRRARLDGRPHCRRVGGPAAARPQFWYFGPMRPRANGPGRRQQKGSPWTSTPGAGAAFPNLPTVKRGARCRPCPRPNARPSRPADTWWEADLFSGNPDWRKLLDVPAATLTPDERQFIDGPVAQLCAMLDEWDISWNRRDLPPEVWAFLKAQRFGMIIPRRHGGLGFALRAFRGGAPHLRLLGHRRRHRDGAQPARTGRAADAVWHAGATRLLAAAPGRRARDSCFGSTSPRGRLGRGLHDRHRRGSPPGGGRARADRHPAELAQAPHHAGAGGHGAGLAFKLSDPDGILGEPRDIGISVALVPVDAPGVEIGRRHLPAMQAFRTAPIAAVTCSCR